MKYGCCVRFGRPNTFGPVVYVKKQKKQLIYNEVGAARDRSDFPD